MRWGTTFDKLVLAVLNVTYSITLQGTGEFSHTFVVCGGTPVEWTVDRPRIHQNKERSIVNDQNAWLAENPARAKSDLQRLVHLSVEPPKTVDRLPTVVGVSRHGARSTGLTCPEIWRHGEEKNGVISSLFPPRICVVVWAVYCGP